MRAASFTLVSMSARGILWFSSPNARFWYTVMCGYSAYDWKTIARPRCAAEMSFTRLPSISSSPSLTDSSPAIIRRSVDLPQPEGPTKTTNSPSCDVEVDAVDDHRLAVALDDALHLKGSHRERSLPGKCSSVYFTPAEAMPVVM